MLSESMIPFETSPKKSKKRCAIPQDARAARGSWWLAAADCGRAMGAPEGCGETGRAAGGQLHGLRVGSGANPDVRRNQIYGSARLGVRVRRGGRGVLSANFVHSNALAGCQIEGEGSTFCLFVCLFVCCVACPCCFP